MAVILPLATEANDLSQSSIAANIAKANAAFIASATVLINNAVNLGFYQIQPFVIPYLDISTVSSYFQGLGYTVLFPATWGNGGCSCGSSSPGYPYEPCFVSGFPEALPPGYIPWNCSCGESGPLRVQISWGSPVPPIGYDFLLLESGDVILLENGVDSILLET